jgi:lipopolysaccharide/colanic/teichoic acid biosynthesis glycosyltransferase
MLSENLRKVFIMKKVLRNIYLILKRVFEFLISLILFVVLLIPFIVIAIAIKIEDRGPVLYKQTRIGKKRKPFQIYKFRSMKTNRKELDSDMTHDEMVTKVGRLIRKTSLDELPQLINILKGEMGFIGPRPWIPEYYEWFTEEQKRRSDVLPGITGLAQAKGRNNINIFKKIEYDLEYVDNVSLFMDLKIIWLTMKEVFATTGAEASETEIKAEIEDLRRNNNEMQQL